LQQGAYQYANLVMAGLSIYLLIMLAVGWWSHKQIRNSTDFIIAGRRLPLFLTTGTLFATWFCGGTLMGTAAQSYLFGNQGVIFDPWGSTLSLLLTGLIFARLIRRGGYLTVIDFFDLRYGKKMGLLAALVQVVAEIGWVGGQLVAFGVILQLFAGIPVFWGITLSCAVLIIYTYLGGMWSVTVTDSLTDGNDHCPVRQCCFSRLSRRRRAGSIFSPLLANRAGISPLGPSFPQKNTATIGYFGLRGMVLLPGSAGFQPAWGISPPRIWLNVAARAKNERGGPPGAQIIAAAPLPTVGMVPVLLGSIMYGLNPELTIAES